MSSYYVCHECRSEIDNGRAILRSMNFEQTAFHPECLDAHRARRAVMLAERIAGTHAGMTPAESARRLTRLG